MCTAYVGSSNSAGLTSVAGTMAACALTYPVTEDRVQTPCHRDLGWLLQGTCLLLLGDSFSSPLGSPSILGSVNLYLLEVQLAQGGSWRPSPCHHPLVLPEVPSQCKSMEISVHLLLWS